MAVNVNIPKTEQQEELLDFLLKRDRKKHNSKWKDEFAGALQAELHKLKYSEYCSTNPKYSESVIFIREERKADRYISPFVEEWLERDESPKKPPLTRWQKFKKYVSEKWQQLKKYL